MKTGIFSVVFALRTLAILAVCGVVSWRAEGALEVREVSDGVFSVLRDGRAVAINVHAIFQSGEPQSVERSRTVAADGSKVWNRWSKDDESRFRFEVVQRTDGAVELSILGSAYGNAGNRQRGIRFDLPKSYRGKGWQARVDTLKDNPRQEGVFGEDDGEFRPRELSSDGIVFDFNPAGPGEFLASGNNFILPVWKAKTGVGEGAVRLEGLADFDNPLGGFGGTKVVIREGTSADYCRHHVWEYFNYEQQFPATRLVKFGAPKAGSAYVEGNFAFDTKRGFGWMGTEVPAVRVGHRSGAYYSHAVGDGRAVYRFAGLEPGYYLATVQLGNYTDEANRFTVTAAGEKLGGELSVGRKKARTVSRFVHVDGGTCDFVFEGKWLVSAIALQMRLHDSEDFTIRRGFWYVEGYEPAIAYCSEYYRQPPEFSVSDETIDMPVPGEESADAFRKPPMPVSLPDPKDVEWTSKMRLWKLMINNSTMMELADDVFRERLFAETLARRPYNVVMFNGMLSRHTFPKERIELGKQLTSKFVKTAKRHGLKTVEHVDLTLLWNREVGVRTMIERTGQLIHEYENNLPSLQLCINNPGMKRWIYDYLRGQVEAGYDALMLDECCFFHHGCTCRHCRERFHRETGWQLPLDETDPTFRSYRETALSRHWDEWKKVTSDSWKVEVREYLKQFNPKIVLMAYSTLKNFTLPEVKASARVFSHGRSNRPFPTRSVSVFGNEVMTENVLLGSRPLFPLTRARGLLRTDPAIPPVWNWYYNHNQHCNYFSWCMATMCGQVAFLSDLPAVAGVPDPEAWAGVSRSMDIRESEPEAKVAVLFSVDSRDFNLGDRFEAELLGLAQELEALHVPYVFLGDDYLDAEHLKHYKVVFLGDAQCMRDGGYAALKNFTRTGGRVYGQKGAGLRNEYGEEVAGRVQFAEMSSAAPFRADEVIPWKSLVWEFDPDLKAEEAFRSELAKLVGDAAFWQLRGVPAKVFTSVWRERSGDLLLHFLNATAANLKKGEKMSFAAPAVPFPPMGEDFVITVPAPKGSKAVAYSPDWGVEGRELQSEERAGETLEIRLPKELFKVYALIRVTLGCCECSKSPFKGLRAKLLEFREGTNFRGFKAFAGKGPCSVTVEKGKLKLSGKMDTLGFVPFVYEPQKPFPGPSTVVLQTESSPKGGRAVLRLKERTRGEKPLTFEAAWTGGFAFFDTDLDFGKEYVFDSLDLVIPNGRSAVQNVTVEKLEGIFRTDAVHACSFEVVTKSPLHTLDWNSKETAVAILRNRTGKPLSVSGNLTVSDFYGRSFNIPVDARIEGNSWSKKEIPLPRDPGKVDAKGVWRVVAALRGEDGSVATFEDRFAVLDEHPVTPKVPYGKFRAGIHCHSARWLDEGRDLTHDAAVRMGAKIVRIDGVFSQFAAWDAKKNGFDFTKADRFLDGLEERGLAVDAIILGNGSFKNFTEDFCEQLARHYGERIDYYEIGNEWDLIPKERLTPEKGVEWQKLAYRGLKKGNPKVRVTTNGWAVEDSNGHANVTQKGFQETFMKEAKGAYDVHAMHLHFPFQNYVDRMGRFFKLREVCGVTAPFILNETALNVQYRGEEEVAENVWLKIIYGWAHGATDYIWYNMRASGYDPGGTYGVVNREFRPRLTYAAFSGFTAALGDHDFDRILVEKEGRKIYRFKHRTGRELVIAGWDTGLLKPIEVKVKTDARKVWIADVMNNRREVAVTDGEAKLVLSGAPQAWVFEGATFAKPEEAILSPTKAPPRVIHVSPVRPGYGWDMLLDRYAQVHEEYPADPATAHRTWKGKDDCSGIALFNLKDGRANLCISVRDEKDAPGDTVQVWRDGKDVTPALKFVRTRHGDCRTTYEAAWPDLETCRINVRFVDDDGFGGVDGWVDYVPFDARKPDATAWPVLRFE